jgi:hypothetical protein
MDYDTIKKQADSKGYASLTTAQKDIFNNGAAPAPLPVNATSNPNDNAYAFGPNQTTQTPAATAPYTIKYGDTLSGLALKNGTTVQALMAANPYITDANKIYAGKDLVIPTQQNKTQTVQTTNGIREQDAKVEEQYNKIIESKTPQTIQTGNGKEEVPPPQVTTPRSITDIYLTGTTDAADIYAQIATDPNNKLTLQDVQAQVQKLGGDTDISTRGALAKQVKEYDDQWNKVNAEFTASKASMAAENAAMVDSIMATFAKRREELKKSAEYLHAARTKAGYATDAFRYVGAGAEGLVTDAEQQYITRLSAIDADEKAALLAAAQAKSKQDFDALGKQMDVYNQLNDDRINVILKLNDMATAENKRIADEAKAIKTAANDSLKNTTPLIYQEYTNATNKEAYLAGKAKELGIDIDVLKSNMITEGQRMDKYNLDIAKSKKTLAGKDSKDDSTYTEGAPSVSWEDYLKMMQEEAQQTFTEETRAELKKLWEEKYPATIEGTTEFTAQELKKLELAGLLKASRREQLDYLFGDDEEALF